MMSREEHTRAMQALCIVHITSPAENRMRTRTAREQLAADLADANRDRDATVPDSDEESLTRKGVLS